MSSRAWRILLNAWTIRRFSARMQSVQVPDGFAGQRIAVVPRPLVSAALDRAATRRLTVTDAGYFPSAEGHRRGRMAGARETIVIICTAGIGWLDVDAEVFRIGPATAFVIPSGTPHSYGASDNHPWTIWWIHVRGSDVPDLLEAIGSMPERPVFSLRSPERTTGLVDEIIAALERATTQAALIATAGMAWHLLTRLAADRMMPAEGAPLQRALRYLEDRIDAQTSVPELAHLIGVSPSHLSSLFRKVTGGGVTAHHLALKMARARVLLDTTSLSIVEIASRVGMNDPSYFSRRFRREHGVSPTKYRLTRKG